MKNKTNKIKKGISAGTVHNKVPKDLRQVIDSSAKVKAAWEDITPLARNEWICWVEEAKKSETREHRMNKLWVDLKEGKRRPCCWQGCPHR